MLLLVFCTRLAFGLLGSMLLLLPWQINSRFYRAHFLIALGLTAGAFLLANHTGNGFLWPALLAVLGVCLLGSMVWMLRDAPGGRFLNVAAALVSASALALLCLGRGENRWFFLADDFTSAAYLGAAVTAMLLGHSYLNAPAMSIAPLQRLLAAVGIFLILRVFVAAFALRSWTADPSAHTLDSTAILWLVVRWVAGFLLPAVLVWMAWETARIRSTQSATGILYVLVICCFLGELTGQLLMQQFFLA